MQISLDNSLTPSLTPAALLFTRSESPSPDALEAIHRSLPEISETIAVDGSRFLLFDSQPDAGGQKVTAYQDRGDVQYDMEAILEDYEAPFSVSTRRNAAIIERCDFAFDGQAEPVRRLELISFKLVD